MRHIPKFIIALSVVALFTGCGKIKEAQDAVENTKKAVDAAKDMNKAVEKTAEHQDEAQKLYEERKAKGDTVSMDYKALQEFLPKSISGYKADGGPSGSKTAIQGFGTSNAEQNYVSETDPNSHIKVSIIDYGGTQGAYGLAELGLNFVMESEDDHQRTATMKFDMPLTSGFEKLNKDTKDADVTIGTRYRYFITVNATGQKDDQTALVKQIGTDIAKSFEGK